MLLATLLLACSQKESTPVELGRVAWGRDHELAFQAARGSKKPVLLFFQEVPG